jgi:hypothetical protein
MKNSMRITVGVAAILFAATGFCFGQTVTTKTNDLTNKADKSSGNSVSKTQEDANEARRKATLEAHRRGRSEATPQQLLRLMDQEDSIKKANELWITDMKEPVKDDINIQRTRHLNFNNESKKAEVKINMTDDYNYLGIMMRGWINTGCLEIELIDPNGNIKGKYTLKSDVSVVTGDKTSTTETVTGEMDKRFSYPIKGEWIIRAIPSSATSGLVITIDQQYHDRLAPIDDNRK